MLGPIRTDDLFERLDRRGLRPELLPRWPRSRLESLLAVVLDPDGSGVAAYLPQNRQEAAELFARHFGRTLWYRGVGLNTL